MSWSLLNWGKNRLPRLSPDPVAHRERNNTAKRSFLEMAEGGWIGRRRRKSEEGNV
jgi:hypothetical protein